MSRFINPLLIDKSVYAVSMVGNYTSMRPSAVEMLQGPTFAQELETIQAKDKVQETSKAESKTAPKIEAAESLETEETTTPYRIDNTAAENVEEDEDFGFDDFVDIINPLQHIPIVGTIYREMTGDTIKPVPRIVGDVAFGALTGSLLITGAASIASAAIEENEGEEPLMMVADLFFGADEVPETNDAGETTMLASLFDTEEAPGTEKAEMVVASVETTDNAVSTPLAAPKVEPVQTASVDQSVVTVASATTKGKQPFGGIMDPSALGGQTKQIALAETAPAIKQGTATRLGNTIYASPAMNQAARINAARAAQLTAAQKASVTNETRNTEKMAEAEKLSLADSIVQSSQTSAAISPSSLMSMPGTTPTDSQTLGQLMHQSAKTVSNRSNALPPELVRDMMMMALDKYKTASGMAPSEMNIGTLN